MDPIYRPSQTVHPTRVQYEAARRLEQCEADLEALWAAMRRASQHEAAQYCIDQLSPAGAGIGWVGVQLLDHSQLAVVVHDYSPALLRRVEAAIERTAGEYPALTSSVVAPSYEFLSQVERELTDWIREQPDLDNLAQGTLGWSVSIVPGIQIHLRDRDSGASLGYASTEGHRQALERVADEARRRCPLVAVHATGGDYNFDLGRDGQRSSEIVTSQRRPPRPPVVTDEWRSGAGTRMRDSSGALPIVAVLLRDPDGVRPALYGIHKVVIHKVVGGMSVSSVTAALVAYLAGKLEARPKRFPGPDTDGQPS